MLTKSSTEIPGKESLCPCKKAHWSDLERIRRGRFVKTFFFWLPIKKYKCYKCLGNKWVWG